ncbi:hypothetical protein WQQ_34390 [Hydrocarboniphaga effusa AP103]|uniref:Uncharacterized protein n=1 Tax=Hydrocarboniphaga effusa AP103 TaxID=1172194 RepID=I7ZDR5_9GAMM|nr:hypothetical protein WQQ_34390 [Hydrocarboniphaga effusa AP103]
MSGSIDEVRGQRLPRADLVEAASGRMTDREDRTAETSARSAP